MRYIEFDPEKLEGEERTEWLKWIERSKKATKKIVQQHKNNEKIKFNDNVWKDLKVWLLEHVFNNKCAYCEGKYIAGTHNAAEHWRPKGKVTDNGKNVEKNDGTSHPGYWWLAYEWRNLVPSCDKCNGEPGGKMNEFPVGNSHVFEDLTDIDTLNALEDPLLLHPYNKEEKPEDNLKFGLQGVVAEDASSRRGKETIRVCNLGRKTLNEERAEEQEKSEDRWFSALLKFAEDKIPIDDTMEKFIGPKARYSQSVKAYIDYKTEKFAKALQHSYKNVDD